MLVYCFVYFDIRQRIYIFILHLYFIYFIVHLIICACKMRVADNKDYHHYYYY